MWKTKEKSVAFFHLGVTSCAITVLLLALGFFFEVTSRDRVLVMRDTANVYYIKKHAAERYRESSMWQTAVQVFTESFVVVVNDWKSEIQCV